MSHDALVLLREDHQKIRRCFRAYARADADQERGRVVHEMTGLLMSHSFVELEAVYPKLREACPPLTPQLLLAAEEQHLADHLITQLAGSRPSDERFDPQTSVLIDLVGRHIVRVETDVMPTARKLVPRKVLQELGGDVLTARAQAPEPGPGSRLEQAVGALLGH